MRGQTTFRSLMIPTRNFVIGGWPSLCKRAQIARKVRRLASSSTRPPNVYAVSQYIELSTSREQVTGNSECTGLNRHEGVSSGKLVHSVRIISPG